MIKHYCDICAEEIKRNYVSERFCPHKKKSNHLWGLDVIVSQDGTFNKGELCLVCLKKIFNEGEE